jgi:hypothetical protein
MVSNVKLNWSVNQERKQELPQTALMKSILATILKYPMSKGVLNSLILA